MSKLEEAVARLNASLDALEKIAAPLAETAARDQHKSQQLTELTEERQQLLARLASLEEDARALASTNEQIEIRLDTAIGEIHAALGR